MRWNATIALVLAALLSGCETAAGSGGDNWARPIYPKLCPAACDRTADPDCGPPVCDLLTEETASQIENHNETGALIEGW